MEFAQTGRGVELETVACDLCGSRNAPTVTDSRDYWHGFGGTFPVVQCGSCGLVYLNPRPTESCIGAFYPEDYYAYGATKRLPRVRVRTRIKRAIRARRLLAQIALLFPGLRNAARDFPIREDIPEWTPPGRMLDVGCGSGGVLSAMFDMGWHVVGLEPNAAAAAVARTNGHEVWCQSAGDPLPSDLPFDLILVSHTLEHLHSPRRALTSFRTVLRPSSGRIVLEVPNLDSLFTRLFQGLGTAFDTPRHLYLFGPATLERLLVETGFEVLRVRHRSDPRQIAKSLALVYKLFETRATAGSLVQDGELLAALQPLVDLASARHMGGAIRITARRAE